jgi:ABC-type dipeptide/oligopeptide/nickel transport system permease component
MGAALLAAGLVVTASLLTDLAYALLDPRIRYS